MTNIAIRVASLPVSALEELRFNKTWAAVNEVVATSRWLGEEGRRLSDELYAVIGIPAARPLKGRLVALRRAVFTGRRLATRLWNPEVRAVLPPALVAALDDWDERYRARDGLLAELPDLLEQETALTAERLRAALHAPAFQYGLVLGSPALFEELTKWLDSPPGTVPARQTLLRLTKYLARVVAKTSPYSTFTISGLTGLRPDVAEAVRPTGEFAWTSVAELNMWLIRRLAAATTGHPGLLRGQALRENPSLVRDDTTLRFVAGGPRGQLAAVRRSRALDECLRLITEQPGSTVDDVCRHLRQLDAELGDRQVFEYVTKLTRTGLVQVQPPFGEQEGDHLAALVDRVERSQVAELAPLATALGQLGDDLHAYPRLGAAHDRYHRAQQIVTRLGEVVATAEGPAGDPLPRKNLFHENAVFTRPVAEAGQAAWAPVLADLETLRPLFAMFDPDRPLRDALTSMFRASFGSGASVPWLDVYQRMSQLIAGGRAVEAGGVDGATLQKLILGVLGADEHEWRALPFAGTHALQRDLLASRVMDRAVGSGADTVRLRPEELVDLADPPATLTDAFTCYLQPLGQDEELRVVLNTVTGGYGRGLTRLERLLDQAGAPAGERHPAETGPDGTLLVECDGAFDNNLNLRAAGTRYVLDYPGTAPSRPGEWRIPLADLLVEHDPDTDRLRLRSRRHGRELRPVHGGLMAEMWLPPALRHLIAVFGAPPTLVHASMPMFLPREYDPRDGGVRMMPRIEAGRITLSRRCWAFPAGELPARTKGERDVSFWTRFADWLATHGMPERCFVRVVPGTQTMWRPDLKSRKPTYVDAAVWPLVALLERSIGGTDDLVVLTEALPDLRAAPRYGDAGHVTELMVEFGTEEARD